MLLSVHWLDMQELVLFVCHFSPYPLNNFSVIWWWSTFIGERENLDTLYNVFGERPPIFRKKTDKLSHTFSLVRVGFEPMLTVGERPRGMWQMSCIFKKIKNRSPTHSENAGFSLLVDRFRPEDDRHQNWWQPPSGRNRSTNKVVPCIFTMCWWFVFNL
jgi:hypothetical protein